MEEEKKELTAKGARPTETPSADVQSGKTASPFITALKKVIAFIRTKIIGSEYFYLVGAFALPVLLMVGAHAAVGFYPFGNSSILSLDF